MREALRDRDFRLLAGGQLASNFGDTALLLALGVWVKQLTGSSAAAGLTFLFVVLPSVFAPFGGYVVDRVRRRPFMIAVDLASAAVVCLLLLVHGSGQVWLIYLVALGYGASLALFSPARSALVATMLPSSQLDAANSSLFSIKEGLRVVGPPIGVLVYTRFGGGVTAVADAVTFCLSAASLAAMRLRDPRPTPYRRRPLAELAAGAAHIRSVPALRGLVLPMVACALVIGFFETLMYAVIQHGLGRPATFFSVVSAIQGAGAIAGGLAATWLCRRFGELGLTGLGLATSALGSLLLAAHGLPVVAPGIVLFGLGLPWLLVGINTAIMRATPRRLQGRVDGALETTFSGPQVLSIAVGAALVTVVDYRMLLLVAVAVLLASGIVVARIGAVPNLVDEAPSAEAAAGATADAASRLPLRAERAAP
jgi:MFS family permease